jgi:hemolysin D
MPPTDPQTGPPELPSAPLPALENKPVQAKVSWWERWLSRKRREDELAFMPSAIEVMERPASPAARAVAITVMAFFVIAVAWAIIGKVDIVAIAQGKIVPLGGLQSIQPLEIGVVRAIHVRDGQEIKKGDLLIELDPTESEVDKSQVIREYLASRIELSRLEANLRALDGRDPDFKPPANAPDHLIRMHKEKLKSDLLAQEAKLASYDAEFSRRIAERAAIMAERNKLKSTIPLIREREVVLKRLTKTGNAPRRQWLEVKQALIEQQQNLIIQGHRAVEADAALISAQKQRDQLVADARREALSQMVEVRNKMTAAELQLRSAEKRQRLQKLTAPVDGTVQQLQVHTVGGVVQPAQVLMVLVPKDTPLEVDAMVLNKDKGFVHAGQEAQVKLESFPYTKYGTIPGKLMHLSGDAIQDEKLGLVYGARVSLSRTTIRVGGKNVAIVPGMAVTIEIKTGKRRIIEFVMAPLLRYQSESLRER